MKTDQKVVAFLWLWRIGWLVGLGTGPLWLKIVAAVLLASSWKDGAK